MSGFCPKCRQLKSYFCLYCGNPVKQNSESEENDDGCSSVNSTSEMHDYDGIEDFDSSCEEHDDFPHPIKVKKRFSELSEDDEDGPPLAKRIRRYTEEDKVNEHEGFSTEVSMLSMPEKYFYHDGSTDDIMHFPKLDEYSDEEDTVDCPELAVYSDEDDSVDSNLLLKRRTKNKAKKAIKWTSGKAQEDRNYVDESESDSETSSIKDESTDSSLTSIDELKTSKKEDRDDIIIYIPPPKRCRKQHIKNGRRAKVVRRRPACRRRPGLPVRKRRAVRRRKV